jgi:fructose-1,6-bisphosphatase
VNRSYERVIPFRQQKFINAFIKWVVLDNVKHRKACSTRLKRAFKIANIQAVSALPKHYNTIASWIDEIFDYFEPEVKEEIRIAKSKIHVSFDGWGSKHEKLSIIGIIVYFINNKRDMVTRLISLPELPNYKKTGVGKCQFSYIARMQLYS